MANQYTTAGQPKRTRMVPVRLTEQEYAVLSMVADNQKCGLSEFIRYCLTLQTIGDAQRTSHLKALRAATEKLRQKGK
jgi:hypothetical protein